MSPLRRPHLVAGAALLLPAMIALGCGSRNEEKKPAATAEPAKPATQTPQTQTGCSTDHDCKGNRICVKAQCVDPPNKAQSPSPPPAQPPRPAPATRRSPVPSDQDWHVVGEVTVTGSSRMNCETKKIREWVRVRCHGKNEAGNTPRGVTVLGTTAADATFPSSSPGNVVLVFPFTEGTEVDAIFRWTSKEHHQFRARWPSGAGEPAAKGEFLGVPPPSDPNRVWPCMTNADCNSPYKCGFQGNCMKM